MADGFRDVTTWVGSPTVYASSQVGAPASAASVNLLSTPQGLESVTGVVPPPTVNPNNGYESAGFPDGSDAEAPLQGSLSSRWTGGISKKRKFPFPTSDNYSDWTSDQLRAECTNRSLKPAKGTSTDARRQLLQTNDEEKNAIRAIVEGSRDGGAAALVALAANTASTTTPLGSPDTVA
eukprot:GHVU01065920.1.p2 GENE.GHVU01065920.1~~GHVU01065920.1.p2  ORF type:complete len:179 (-),score=16.56 GHVU01065920.1:606-1142(-)